MSGRKLAVKANGVSNGHARSLKMSKSEEKLSNGDKKSSKVEAFISAAQEQNGAARHSNGYMTRSKSKKA